MGWEIAVAVVAVGVAWALAWWDVRRRQSESLRASELEALHVKLGALETVMLDRVGKVEAEWQKADASTVEVVRDLAKQFSSMKLAIGMSPGTRARDIRSRYAEASEKT